MVAASRKSSYKKKSSTWLLGEKTSLRTNEQAKVFQTFSPTRWVASGEFVG